MNAPHTRLAGFTAAPLRTVAAAAAQIQHHAYGAEGRRRTRRALRALEHSGWQVSHTISLPGDISVDHLAVGPSGVFILDSKAWPGVVTVDSKGATITPSDDPGAAWTARGHHRALPPAAAAVVHRLAAATGNSVRAPRAVVVIWGPFPERVAVSGSVTYVAGEHLVEWLTAQPRLLDESHLRSLLAVDLSALLSTHGSVTSADRALVPH